MFRETERSLTAAERDDLADRRRALGERIASVRREERDNRLGVTRIMLGLTMAFAALAVINAVTGHRLASLAAAGGVAMFAAIAARVGRRVDVASVDTTELARIDETLATDRVLVYAIEADAAFVLADRSSDSFGHVLRVDHEHYVYVRSETCAGIDPEQLPSTRLLVEWAVPLGLLRAEAQGDPVAELLRIEPITRERAETELISDLVAYQTTWAELERRLSGG
ncbi:MAG: hypothetical protein ABI867_19140 [Kofleriaceae bacterium]